jgi:hypothetical protein
VSAGSKYKAPPRERRGLYSRRFGGRFAHFLGPALVVLGFLPASGIQANAPDSPRFGRDVAGRWGLGMLSPAVPLGLRYHFDNRMGAEAGVALRSRSQGGSSRTDFTLEGALFYALAPGDRTNLYLRPAAGFFSEQRADGTYSTVVLGVGLLFEVFLTPDFSVSATQGLSIDFVGPPPGHGPASDDRTDIALGGDRWPHLGFVYYLP